MKLMANILLIVLGLNVYFFAMENREVCESDQKLFPYPDLIFFDPYCVNEHENTLEHFKCMLAKELDAISKEIEAHEEEKKRQLGI